MHSRSVLRRALFLCLLPAAFAACDRHEPGEPAETYGHGSSHDKSYTSHGRDSSGAAHYSDTAGAEEKKESTPAPGETHTAEGKKRFNPGGQ